MEREYVGIDLYRRRSVIVRKDAGGELLETVQIDNDPLVLCGVVGRAREPPEVVLEACYGWYWAADVLVETGAIVHLAHPLGNNWGNRRVKPMSVTPPTWWTCCAGGAWRRRGSPRPICVSCESWSAIGPSW